MDCEEYAMNENIMKISEEWRPVVGYEGYYSVSSLGNVRRDKPYKNTVVGKILKPAKVYGYHSVSLSKDCQSKSCRVHKLVCMAFIGERPEDCQINHLNGIKHDNRVDNLEYCTQSRNMKHAHSLGLLHQRGAKNNNARLTNEDAIRVKIMFKNGMKDREVSDATGFNKNTLRGIRLGLYWKHIHV